MDCLCTLQVEVPPRKRNTKHCARHSMSTLSVLWLLRGPASLLRGRQKRWERIRPFGEPPLHEVGRGLALHHSTRWPRVQNVNCFSLTPPQRTGRACRVQSDLLSAPRDGTLWRPEAETERDRLPDKTLQKRAMAKNKHSFLISLELYGYKKKKENGASY